MISEEKINTLESLLTVDGKLNSAITRRKEFKTFKIFKYVIENTKELDCFNDVKWSDRFYFLLNEMSVSSCSNCGKPYIFFPISQNTYRLCKHHFNVDVKKMVETKKTKSDMLKNKLAESLNDKNYMLDKDVFKNLIDEYFSKKDNYTFILTKSNIDFQHDLIVKTSDILPYETEEPKISERLYIVKNELTEPKKCKYCENPVPFINRKVGYQSTCGNIECRTRFLHDEHKHRYDQTIEKNIDSSKYEIISTPSFISNDPLKIKCLKCGNISEIWLYNGRLNNIENMIRCHNCESSSNTEFELFSFIEKIYNGKIERNTKKIISPKEIDIYVPDRNLAFEFDGLYWHSQNNIKNLDKNYHLNKTTECLKKDIQLIHIFENEWIFKQEIVKSRIKNLFGLYDKTIYARKCVVKEIDSKTAMKFLDENHIQGMVNSKIRLGLFFENELISLMTFGKSRFSKKYEWELLRFCNKLNHHIPGAASKLLKHFERNWKPKSLISYADKRWSIGKLYDALGFKLSHESSPDYWYTKNSTLYHRTKFQKHKLKNILKNFNENKSEYQNMIDNGYTRIYDCGNMVFVKNY